MHNRLESRKNHTENKEEIVGMKVNKDLVKIRTDIPT